MPVAIARPFGHRARRKPFWNSNEAFFSDACLFILGVAGAWSANFVGSLPGCEILLFPILPVLLLARGKRAFNREYAWFYVLVAAWLLGTLIADAYNDIPAFNRAKGTARVVFFALDFMALAILINKKTRRIVIFALSIAGVMFINSWEFRPNLNVEWKFGLSEGLAITAMLASSYFYAKRRYSFCISISLVLAALNLAYGFRSQLAVHFVAAVLILPFSARARTQRSAPRSGQDVFRIIILLLLVGGAAYAANAAIEYGAKRGLFDESTRAKFETQARGDYGVLVGGRPETLVAIQAIRDSPILGHGSFPYGPKYMQLKQDIQYEHGYTDSDEAEEPDYPVIPTHSHLTLAWVEGGILGGICWIYILILTLRGVFRLSVLRPHLAPLYSYLLVSFLWDILYSPFGSVNRIWAAFYILLSYNILANPVSEALPVRRQKAKMLYGAREFRLARRGAY